MNQIESNAAHFSQPSRLGPFVCPGYSHWATFTGHIGCPVECKTRCNSNYARGHVPWRGLFKQKRMGANREKSDLRLRRRDRLRTKGQKRLGRDGRRRKEKCKRSTECEEMIKQREEKRKGREEIKWKEKGSIEC